MAKPVFDPSKPFERASAAPAFDPSKPFERASKESAPTLSDAEKRLIGLPVATAKGAGAKPEPSSGEALLRGAGQGATLGFEDEIEGALPAAMQGLYNAGRAIGLPTPLGNTDANGKPLGALDVYRAVRDEERAKNAAAQEAHSGLYLAGNLAGGALTAGLAPGVGAGLGGAVKAGAALGAAGGLGASDADLTKGDVRGAALDALGGGAFGAAGGAAGHGIASGLGALGDDLAPRLRKFAEMRATKAAGAIQSDLTKLGDGEAEQIGRDLLDSGAVSPLASKENVLDRARQLKGDQGARLSSVYDVLDNATGGRGFDMQEVVDRARREVLAPAAGDPALAPQANDLSKLLDEYEKTGKGGMGFADAAKMKSSLQQNVSKFVDTPIAKQFRAKLSSIMRDEIEQQATKAVGGAGDEVADANQLYGSFKTAERLARKGVNREAGNRFLSLGDRLGGASLGALVGSSSDKENRAEGGLLGAAAGFAGGKFLRQYGPSLAATGIDALAGTFERTGGSLVDRALQQEPAALAQWAAGLFKAKAEGWLPEAHYTLSQTDPDYQRRVRELAANDSDQRPLP